MLQRCVYVYLKLETTNFRAFLPIFPFMTPLPAIHKHTCVAIPPPRGRRLLSSPFTPPAYPPLPSPRCYCPFAWNLAFSHDEEGLG